MIDDNVLNRFKRLIKAKRLAHAYLFAGPKGIGKIDTALVIAQLVNCLGDEGQAPCGTCASCHKIVSGNHPDVHWIGKDIEESAIKIDEVRQMIGRAGLRAYEAKCKVFIVLGVERLTTEAGNALLKTLEEPAPNTLMILTTAVPEACLDTIKSRCQNVKFFSGVDFLPEDKNGILDRFLGRGNNDDYFKELSADKEQAGEAMLVLHSFMRDVMLFKSGANPKDLLYQERLNEVNSMSKRNMDDLSKINEQVVHVRQLVDDNLNVKMALSLVRERIWGN